MEDNNVMGGCSFSHLGKKSEVKVSHQSQPKEPYVSNSNINNDSLINHSSISKQGLFNNQPIIEKQENEKIPHNLCCPISFELMEDPVLCRLDKRTYERKNITAWLEKNQSSPFNRKTLELKGRTLEKAISRNLIQNITVQQMIDDFKKDNLEMVKNKRFSTKYSP